MLRAHNGVRVQKFIVFLSVVKHVVEHVRPYPTNPHYVLSLFLLSFEPAHLVLCLEIKMLSEEFDALFYVFVQMYDHCGQYRLFSTGTLVGDGSSLIASSTV